ncbi:MAG: metallophosphoesterase family protein [Candidatus Marinimicrobia bacterium]|nr:metallophosphoesterase family protein [Candidatus Neomarinimicrobiota bacterium]
MMKKCTVLLLLLLSFTLVFAAEPKRIILNPGEESETAMAVTFRFYEQVPTGKIQYLPNAPDVKLQDRAKTLNVLPDIVYTDMTKTEKHFVCSALLEGLKEDTEYAYRVGDGKDWSPWYTFRTAKKGFHEFTMVYLGDTQWGFMTYLPRIYSAAMRTAPNAAFWYIAGDLVDYPYENWQWDDLFRGAREVFTRYPQISAVGNHGYLWAYRDHRNSLPPTWRPHVTQPENGPEGLEETCFYIDYQGVRFIVLNGNERLEDQAEWLENVLKENPNRWTLVGTHQGFYPSGWERDFPKARELFLPLMEKYGVSMVLQGHDHAYTRTYPLREGKIVEDPSDGITYVISNAGAKMYPLKSKFTELFAVKESADKQYFQTLSFYEDSLVYKSYTATGDCHDSLVIEK